MRSMGDALFPLYEKDGGSVSVPLGVSFWKTKENKNLRNMLKVNDMRFYDKILEDMTYRELASPGTTERIMRMDLGPTDVNYSKMDKETLYAHFFRGKRRLERVSDALSLSQNSFFISMELVDATTKDRSFNVTNEYTKARAEVTKTLSRLIEE